MMVGDQRPVVNADRHIGRGQIVRRLLRQTLEAAAEIVAEQAERTALKRQVVATVGRRAQRLALPPHQQQRIVGALADAAVRVYRREAVVGHQRGARIGGQHIEAVIRMIGMT